MAPERLIEVILSDVFEAFALPSEKWRSLWQSPFVPMAITTEDHRELRCTQVAIDAAHQLTDQLWKERADLRQTISREVFSTLSFKAIGEAIVASPRHAPEGAPDAPVSEAFFAAVAQDYLSELDRLTRKSVSTTARHIPCHLFHRDAQVAAFSVGPVKFLPRDAWIAEYVTEPAVFGLVNEVERRAMTLEHLENVDLSDRAAGSARSILHFLGGYGWVASVQIEGHEAVQSHRKASIIVGLALDVIGLCFHLDDVNRFSKAGWRHLLGEVRMASVSGGGLVSGMSASLPGVGGRPEALLAKMSAEQQFFDEAGVLLDAYVTARKTGAAMHLIERWANALYWFGEARRESSDFMAVVDYGCAADGLSGASGSIGSMKKFADAALNPTASPSPNPEAIAHAVNQVYGEGRNKLAHGEVSGLFEDLTETRKVGDALLTELFLVVTPELAKIFQNKPNYQSISIDHAYQGFMALLKGRRV